MFDQKFDRRRSWVAAIMLITASLAACGSDEETSDATTTTASTSVTTVPVGSPTTQSNSESSAATPADPASTTEAPVGPATGSVVKVMVIAPTDNSIYVIDELPVVVEAAADYLNERGGAGGHVIETIYCNDKNDPNEASQCARRAVDEGVVAVVGSASLNMSTSIIPVLEANNIALINAQAYGPLESTSPISFQTAGQFIAGYSAVGDVLSAKGVTSAVFMHSSSAASAATNSNVTNSLAANDITMSAEISMPINAADVTSYVQQAIDAEADAIVVSPAASQTALIVEGLRQAGVDFAETKVISYASTASDLTIAQLGADGLDGLLTFGTYPAPTDPAMADFVAAMDQVDPDHELTRTETSPGAWAAMLLFAQVAGSVEGEVTAESLLAALNTAGPIDIGMGLPPFDPAATNSDRPEYARFSNDSVFAYELQDGGFVSTEPTFIEHAFKSS